MWHTLPQWKLCNTSASNMVEEEAPMTPFSSPAPNWKSKHLRKALHSEWITGSPCLTHLPPIWDEGTESVIIANAEWKCYHRNPPYSFKKQKKMFTCIIPVASYKSELSFAQKGKGKENTRAQRLLRMYFAKVDQWTTYCGLDWQWMNKSSIHIENNISTLQLFC